MRRLLLAVALVVTGCSSPAADPIATTLTSAPPTTTTTTASTTSGAPTSTSIQSTTTVVDLTGPIVVAESAHEIGVQISGNPTPFSLNPLIADGWNLLGDLDPLLFAGALKPGPGGEPVADLVDSLPHPVDGSAVLRSDGLLELTYRIRPDARWEDGTPVGTADFALTLQILQDPGIPIVFRMRDTHAAVSGFEEISPSEFSVSLAPPFTAYRELFPVVVPSHVVRPETFDGDWTETTWPSAGPMRLVSFERFSEPVAGVMSLAPNPQHPEAPSIDLRIDFYQRDDRGDSLALPAFIDGQADILGSKAFDWWRRDEIAERAAIASSPPAIWEVLFIQPGPQRLETNPDSRVDDIVIRRAIAGALLADIASLPGDRITSLVEYFIPGVENPAGGWDPFGDWGALILDGQPLVYESTNGDTTIQIGRAVEPLLEAAGFEVDVRFAGDSQSAFTRFGEGAFETFAVRLVRRPGTVALFELFQALAGEADWFPDVWPDEGSQREFITALDAFADELDPEARLGHLVAAEDALVEAMTVIPLVTREGEQWAYHQARLVGPSDFDGPGGFYATVAEWHRP
jgi:hypothetical protein